ncbi:MAG: 3-dehydroquinate synthase, partial [Lachnospiraceae bacterium]|nr:3-dehydroquinate synthase [Lachnospiraceae bacterium]
PCYDISLESGWAHLAKICEHLETGKKRICIVSDSNVSKYHMEALLEFLKDYCSVVETFTFPAGEEHKQLSVIMELYAYLIESKFDRNDLLFALGGGVVGDMTGFAAATFLRGISFVQVPTSLLAMVDSSIGGKTGVDFSQYKNMVGAFNQPKLVYMNLDSLRSLPQEQFASGMGEVIKHGLIKDASYFQFLLDDKEAILDLEQDNLFRMVAGSCKIKREVVQNDPKEQGERALLNFGHTIGHAVEKLSDFSLSHGACVALGMVAASYISHKIGNISSQELDLIEKTISGYQLPIHLEHPRMSAEEILAATKSDKKMSDGRVKFILLKNIGTAYISHEVDDSMLLSGINYILEK